MTTNNPQSVRAKHSWLICLLLILPPSRAADSPIVGIVLSAENAFVQIPGRETAFAAATGMELRPGYRIRTERGNVRFAFCPGRVAVTLGPQREIVIPDSALPADLLSDSQRLSFCDFPAVAEPGLATVRGVTQAAPTAPPPTVPKADLLGSIARARGFELAGESAAAAVEYHRIAAEYPAATWTRGVRVPIAASPRMPPAAAGGKTFALLIGISQYPPESPLPSLQFADADAKAFAEFLESAKGGGVPKEQIRLLLNGEATRDRIDSSVNGFVAQAAGRQNTLVLFIAAHADDPVTEEDPATGVAISRNPFILTADTNRQDVKTTGYPMDQLRVLIAEQTLRFGRVIVYLDICHAGYVRDAGSNRELTPAVKRVFDAREGTIGMMLASGAKNFAYEADQFGGHGAFTYTVLDGLNGHAARPNQSSITFAELYRYVLNGVGDLTNNTQNPDKFATDEQMLVLDDVTREPGIKLPKAIPLPESATRRRRGVPQVHGKTELSDIASTSEFEALVKKDPLGALPAYARIASDASIPDQVKMQEAEALRVALEERGQQVIIKYLRGEQSPQTKADFELGGRYFEEALRLAPASTFDESRMLFCKGRALIFDREESHYQMAEGLLERAILLDPARSYAYNALGIAYLEQVRTHAGYYARAVAAFHDARRFAPNWAYPLHNLALTYSEQGDFRAALRAYSQAMGLAPEYSYLPYNLALLNQRMNRLDDAEKLYRIALRTAEEARRSGVNAAVSPWKERADILNALGTLAAARHHEKSAGDFYEAALKEDPQLAAAKHNLATLLSRRGPSAEAERLWRENIAADANSMESRLALAEYLERKGDAPEAAVEFEALIQAFPDQTGARRGLAKLYSKAGRWRDAMSQLEAARATSPNDPRLLEELGDAAAKAGKRAEAESAYRDAGRKYTDKRDRKRVAAKSDSP